MIIKGYGILAAFVLFSIAFGSAALILSWLIQPKNPNPVKKSTYECGMEPVGDARIQFDVKYYMFAILFLIFDVESVFLFPFAVAFKKLGLFALVEVFIFIAVLAAGLIFAWKKKALEWE